MKYLKLSLTVSRYNLFAKKFKKPEHELGIVSKIIITRRIQRRNMQCHSPSHGMPLNQFDPTF